MAKRPIFIPSHHENSLLETEFIDFQWHPGISVSQKQKSIKSLHTSAEECLGLKSILEISSKSELTIGIKLSAFNLKLTSLENIRGSVEVFFQGSKVFSKGGPYTDLYTKSSLEAKRDQRLKNSGDLIEFCFNDIRWPTKPNIMFYTWLYLNALIQNQSLADELLDFDAFTDIEFNPKKSINCQAASAAIFKSLVSKSLIEYSMKSTENFIEVLSNYYSKETMIQNTLF